MLQGLFFLEEQKQRCYKYGITSNECLIIIKYNLRAHQLLAASNIFNWINCQYGYSSNKNLPTSEIFWDWHCTCMWILRYTIVTKYVPKKLFNHNESLHIILHYMIAPLPSVVKAKKKKVCSSKLHAIFLTKAQILMFTSMSSPTKCSWTSLVQNMEQGTRFDCILYCISADCNDTKISPPYSVVSNCWSRHTCIYCKDNTKKL